MMYAVIMLMPLPVEHWLLFVATLTRGGRGDGDIGKERL